MALAGWSLRTQLVAACVAIELVAMVLLVAGAERLLTHTLAGQARAQSSQALALLRHALAAPLAQRDYATLQQMLDLARGDRGLDYLVLWDHRGKLAAASGWDAQRPLPARDRGEPDLERDDATLHLAEDIREAGQTLGRLDLGLSTHALRAARAEFLRRGVAIGAVALTVSAALLALLALAITRHLARLADASRHIAGGNYAMRVPVGTGDEIGRLGRAFNTMAAALAQRMAALQASEWAQAQQLAATREEQARLTTLLSALHSGILFADGEGRVVYANAAFSRIWSLAEPLAGQELADLVPLIARQVEPQDGRRLQSACCPHAVRAGPAEVELRLPDGRIIVQRLQSVDEGQPGCGCIWIHHDVTQERETQARAYQALHDPLTRLLNRRGLNEGLRAAIERAAVERGAVALLILDLDDFKQANDLGGHRTGDEILAAVARALTAPLMPGELAARMGGDEFAVLCPGRPQEAAAALAARLIEAVAALRFEAGGRSLHVGCSVGLAMFPDDARTEEDLVQRADQAMYRAKHGGKNRWAGAGAPALLPQERQEEQQEGRPEPAIP